MNRNITITVPVKRKIQNSGYNPFQTGHGVYEDKQKKRSYRKQELRKMISEYR